jgi:hypothetical protein
MCLLKVHCVETIVARQETGGGLSRCNKKGKW